MKAFDQKLAKIRALRTAEAPESALREALAGNQNLLVAQAAAVAGELRLTALLPDLVGTFHRFFDRDDAHCWAKNALAKALLGLEHDGPREWLRGLRHVQLEAAYLRPEDVAAPLRCVCAIGLATCTRMPAVEVVEHVTEGLVDPEVTVRCETARALGMLGSRESVGVLRLKVLTGDEDVNVTGACLTALASLRDVAFVAARLGSEDENLRAEAAAALGESRELAAFEALRDAYDRAAGREWKRTLLQALGASRQEAAIDFLVAQIAPGSQLVAEALVPASFHPGVRQRVEAAIRATADRNLLDFYHQKLPD